MLIGYEWVDIEIQKSTLLLSWLINGYGVSGVYPEFWNSESLTYEWVKEHYNVNWTIQMKKRIKAVKTKVRGYEDLCKKCLTPNICLDFGLFSDCLKGKKRNKL